MRGRCHHIVLPCELVLLWVDIRELKVAYYIFIRVQEVYTVNVQI